MFVDQFGYLVQTAGNSPVQLTITFYTR